MKGRISPSLVGKTAQKKLFTPENHLNDIKRLPFGSKEIGSYRTALRATLYAIHRCHLASYTTDSAWVPLPSQMMGHIAGKNAIWSEVKAALCANGYLLCDERSKHGEKAFCFSLGAKLQDAEWRNAVAAHPKDGKKRPKQSNGKAAPILWQETPIVLPAAIDPRPVLEGLSLDTHEAEAILKAVAVERNWKPRTLASWLYRISEFSPRYTIGKTGRLFTDGNALPREAREALRIDGQRTLEIDVKNCHPLLLRTLYEAPSTEAARWQDLCESGQIYETLMDELKLGRHEVKNEHLLPFIYGGKRPKAEAFFQRNFPELLGRIRCFPKKGSGSLAHHVQRLESQIIVGEVCPAFRGMSVHDAVRVKASDGDAARGMIVHLFKTLHGLTPSLSLSGAPPVAAAA